MARIPTEEIERIKSDVSLQRLVEAKGVKLKPHGKDLIGLCPFHADKSPSLVISPDKNLWHCMGACNQGGSVIDWVMKAEGVTYRHALEILRAEIPALTRQTPVSKAKRSTVPKLELLLERDATPAQHLQQVIEYYHQTLQQSPEALAYLTQRGLQSAEMLAHFKLGFSNRTLGYRLPAKNRQAGAEMRGRLQELGILRSSGHEHFSGSLVIPVIDEHGTITEVYGRKITAGLRKGTPLHLYLPGPHKGVWNLQGLEGRKEVILCESLIDALTFWCAGYHNVTSAYGVSGFLDEHLQAFKRFEVERVLIAYDRDEAGDKAAKKIGERLNAAGITPCRIEFPRGMDANEYARQVQPAAKSLGVVIHGATWLGPGKASAQRPTTQATPSPETPMPPAQNTDATPKPAQEPPTAPSTPAAPSLSLAAPTPEPPPATSSEARTEQDKDEVVLHLGDRRWRVRGLLKNTSYAQMRVNVLCSKGDAFHVDSFDLYAARHRTSYLKQASDELSTNPDVLKKDLGKVLLRLEELQDAHIQAALTPRDEAPTLSKSERNEALALLQEPKLVERILGDFERCGVVGEETNKLVGYLSATSRKLEEPLAVIIQSSSAAGKSSLMDAVLALMPEEERVQYSAMTGQSLFYMGETNLQHKILAIVEEEGAERASYALKLLQSEGELTIASTGKDPTTGHLVTHDYHVQGPVMIFLTTTAIEIDEELLNRCIVLTVNEDRTQTRAIHGQQRRRRTLEGRKQRYQRSAVLALHRNAQRLLRPLCVVNPYAERLTFLDNRTRTRRDHEKYLTLIDSIALLHQYQRTVKSDRFDPSSSSNDSMHEYIEVTLADIGLANKLAHEVLGRSLDELPPQTHRFLLLLDGMVTAACSRLAMERCDYRFTRRDVREQTGWSYDQVRIHLQRLLELEYILAHRGMRGQSFVYELLYDGQGKDGKPFLPGLLDIQSLEADKNIGTTESLGGHKAEFGGPLDPHLTPLGPSFESHKNAATPENSGTNINEEAITPKNAHSGLQKIDVAPIVEERHSTTPTAEVQ